MPLFIKKNGAVCPVILNISGQNYRLEVIMSYLSDKIKSLYILRSSKFVSDLSYKYWLPQLDSNQHGPCFRDM